MVTEPQPALLFRKRLKDALKVATSGQVALVIVPDQGYMRDALNTLVHLLDPAVDAPSGYGVSPSELHITGHRGSVRFYPATHVTYDARVKRLLDYPATIQTFLHPEVEGL